VNYPILIKFGIRVQISIPSMEFDKKSKFCKFKMADGRHIEMAISRRHIGRLMQISEWRWRITCRYRSRDQNCNFCKFKMADGCHFENSFISISQSWIVRFLSNLAHGCKFPFRAWNLTKKSKFFKFKMADGRHIENRFLAISWRLFGRLTRNSD